MAGEQNSALGDEQRVKFAVLSMRGGRGAKIQVWTTTEGKIYTDFRVQGRQESQNHLCWMSSSTVVPERVPTSRNQLSAGPAAAGAALPRDNRG